MTFGTEGGNQMELTRNQIWVLEELRRQNHYFIAAETEERWKQGLPYYIDTRVSVKGIRRKFEQGNREAVERKE